MDTYTGKFDCAEMQAFASSPSSEQKMFDCRTEGCDATAERTPSGVEARGGCLLGEIEVLQVTEIPHPSEW